APWSANKDVGAFETDRFGPLHLHAKVGQIVLPHPAAIGAMILDYSLGDVTFVERIPSRLEASLATSLARSGCFLIDHVGNGVGQIGLDQNVSRLRRLAARQIDRRILRPAAIIIRMIRYDIGHERRHRKTFARETYGFGGALTEGKR